MALWRDNPDAAADALIVASLGDLALSAPNAERAACVDAGSLLPRALFGIYGRHVCEVGRRASVVTPEPARTPPAEWIGTISVACVRLPKSKDELDFTVHRALGWLNPTGRLFVYGGNDEGIRSVAKRLQDMGLLIETVAAHSHGRILAMQRPASLEGLKIRDADWRTSVNLDLGDNVPRAWVSYPGLFASGKLDTGTAMLLQHLPRLPANARVLDYGCGTGGLSRALVEQEPTLNVTALDADIYALEAIRENVPTAKPLLGHRLKDSGRHDLIVSNPPIHNGFREDYTALHQMIEDAPKHLLPKGSLLFVVQRRVPVEAQLKAQFNTVEAIADNGPFRIWSASQPIKQGRAHGAGAKNPSSTKPPLQKYGDIEISDEVEEW